MVSGNSYNPAGARGRDGAPRPMRRVEERQRRAALVKRLLVGKSKKYNGRARVQRFDSQAPSLVGLTARPVRLWGDGAIERTDVADGAVELTAKVPRLTDKRRPEAPFTIDMKSASGRVLRVEFLELAYPRPGSKGGAKAVVRLMDHERRLVQLSAL